MRVTPILRWDASGAIATTVRDVAPGGSGRGRGHGRRRADTGEAARDLREKGAFDIARIEEIETVTQHDVIAFTTAVAEKVGPSARWLHFGLTSSDVVDTAQAIQMREACDVILADLEAARAAVQDTRLRAPHDADDRPHARRPCRADDLRLEARAVARRARSRRSNAPSSRARGDVGRQDLGRGRHLRPSRSVDRSRRLPSARPRARARSRRRSFSATATRSCSRRSPSPPPRSRSLRSRFADCRRPRLARSKSRSARARRARRPCRTSAIRSAASRLSGWRA